MRQCLAVFAFFGLLSIYSTLAQAQSDNVYVQLYEQRLAIARIDVRKQQEVVTYERAQLDRAQRLHATGAVTPQALEDQQRKFRVADLRLEDLNTRVLEAQAMLNIAVERVGLGLDMPICPTVSQ